MSQNQKEFQKNELPFIGLNPTAVFQEAKMFDDTKIKPKECAQVLTKILYVLSQGYINKMTKTEATNLFFGITKLFQSNDLILRRMCYLVLKELSKKSEDVIMITQSLTKDMNSKSTVLKANAIKVLSEILETNMLTYIEKYIKQMIVHKDSHISSAALSSAHHIFTRAPEIVRKWIGEIQEAIHSQNEFVQYLALGLLFKIKQKDKLAVRKLVITMISSKSIIKSPFTHMILIRQIKESILLESEEDKRRLYFDYLSNCLKQRSEIVVLEVAKIMYFLRLEKPNLVPKSELLLTITALQLLLDEKSLLIISALRVIEDFSKLEPILVSTINKNIQKLVENPNLQIATLAVTTLLKTGNEESIDGLLEIITKIFDRISESFKLTIIRAIKILTIKFPKKSQSLFQFLLRAISGNGDYEYKSTVVDSLNDIIENVPENIPRVLSVLCEVIEDCEYNNLSIKIIHLLGNLIPKSKEPEKFIRYIFNRTLLEEPHVRASAITALAKIAGIGIKSNNILKDNQNQKEKEKEKENSNLKSLKEIRSRIIPLIKQCLNDEDDEVRDRAVFYYNIIQEEEDKASKLLLDPLPVSLDSIEQYLLNYKRNSLTDEININEFNEIIIPQEKEKKEVKKEKSPLEDIPKEFQSLGIPFTISSPLSLTEKETEYVVECSKFIFPGFILFKFDCTNTIEDQLLSKVKVEMTPTNKEFSLEKQIEIPKLEYDKKQTGFICFKTNKEFPVGSFTNTLHFVSQTFDTTLNDVVDDGFEDEYQLEDINIIISDYIQKIQENNFEEKWKNLEDKFESNNKVTLSAFKSINEAVENICEFLGLAACKNTDKVNDPKSQNHILLLSGKFLGNIDILAFAKLKFIENEGVLLEIKVRSTNQLVCESIINAI